MTDMITNLFLGFLIGFVLAAYILNPSFKAKVNNMFDSLYRTKKKQTKGKGKSKKAVVKKKSSQIHE